MQFLSTIASLLACASAYSILSPVANQTIAKGSTIDVRWSSVDTDASDFSIYLVNFKAAHFPPTVLSIAQGLERDAGVASIRIPCSVDSDSGYQLNFINGTNTYVIYAQSGAFSLTGDCVDPVAAAATPYSNSSTTIISTVQTLILPGALLWYLPAGQQQACAANAVQTVTVQAGPVAASTVTVTVQAGPVAASTVTVQAGPAAASTVTVTQACPSAGAIVAALAAAQGNTPAAAVAAAPAVSGASSVRASGTVAAAAAGKTALPAALPSASQSSATKVGGAAAGLIAAFVVLML